MLMIALIFLSFISVHGTLVQEAAPRNAAQERAVIQRRRVVLVRTGRIAREFPHKRRAVVAYPVVTVPRNPEVSRRVRALLDFENLFGSSLKEYREDVWLTELDYEVNYNADSLLDVTFRQSGSGAYPDDHQKHFLINLNNGNVVKAADAFEADKLSSLAAAVDRKLQNELSELQAEQSKDKNADPQDRESIKQAYENLKFDVSNLDEFSLDRKGITFLYDAGFPHVIQALAPVGRYAFTFAELKPYIKRSGPLGQFVR